MQNDFSQKRIARQRRAQRTRAKIFGTAKKPRLAAFRSNKHIYVQLINDEKGATLASVSDLEVKKKAKKSEMAKAVGQLMAEKTKSLKIKQVVFDRGGFKYHGLIKAVAVGAREGGLEF